MWQFESVAKEAIVKPCVANKDSGPRGTVLGDSRLQKLLASQRYLQEKCGLSPDWDFSARSGEKSLLGFERRGFVIVRIKCLV
jgi:hypothetical protein